MESLVKIGKPAVPGICELLKDSPANARNLCLQTLTQIGPDAEAAIPTLRKLVEEKKESFPQGTRRCWLASVSRACRFWPRRQDESTNVRMQAIQALGQAEASGVANS